MSPAHYRTLAVDCESAAARQLICAAADDLEAALRALNRVVRTAPPVVAVPAKETIEKIRRTKR